MADGIIRTPAAKTAPKQQYMNLLFEAFSQCVNVAGNSNINEIYKKVELLIIITINLIPNPKTREALSKEREERIDEIDKKYKGATKQVSEKNDEIFKVNAFIIGLIMETCDDFLGIVERQEVMATAEPINQKRLIDKYYPEGLENVKVSE